MNVRVIFTCGHHRTLRDITEDNVYERLSPLFITRAGECLRCRAQRRIAAFQAIPDEGEIVSNSIRWFVEDAIPARDPNLPMTHYYFTACSHDYIGVRPTPSTRRIMGAHNIGLCPVCGSFGDFIISNTAPSRRISGQMYSRDAFCITLGADPEFEIPYGEDATSFLRDRGENDDLQHCPIGADGAGDQIELRPEPAETPDGVVENISNLLTEFAARYHTDLDPRGNEHPCGGHIHVGIAIDGYYDRRYPTHDVILALDAFVGIPSRALNGEARTSYGQPGDVESKRYGFEYRTPPAGIFSNKVVLAQALDIVRHIINAWMTCGLEYSVDRNGMATRESYKVLLGSVPEEFLGACASGQSWVTNSMMAAWDISIPPEPRESGRGIEETERYSICGNDYIQFFQGLRVCLSDTWERPAIRIFANAIAGALERAGVVECALSRYTLFGIAETYGNVVSGIEEGSLPLTFCVSARHSGISSNTCIGLPAVCRWGNINVGLTEQLAETVANHIIEDMRRAGNVYYRSV